MKTRRAQVEQRSLNYTERVDHDVGHVPKERISEPAVCGECKAVYLNGRWAFDERLRRDYRLKDLEPVEVICPACRQIRDGLPAGFLYATGQYLSEHLEEITNLMRNETERMAHENPLWRVMDWEQRDSELTVTTTTAHLAQHLGRVLHRAHAGDVRYQFSDDDVTRVYWERN